MSNRVLRRLGKKTLQRVAQGSAEATSIAFGAHQQYDLILLHVYRAGSTTAPTIPGGWTAVGPAISTGNTQWSQIYYKYAASSGETSGTWTSASGLQYVIYRNALSVFLGNASVQNASSATITFPALGLRSIDTVAPPTVLMFTAHRSVNGSMLGAPAGATNIGGLNGVNSDYGIHEAAGVTSWSGGTVASGETASGYVAYTIEIFPANTMSFLIGNNGLPNLAGMPTPFGCDALISVRGGGAGGGGANKPSSGGWGGGGGGGGGYVRNGRIPAANLATTWSLSRGLQGAGGTNAATAGTAGGDSQFTSGSSNIFAGGGQGGQPGGSSGNSNGGTGGTVSGVGFSTYEIAESGGNGGNGSRASGVAGGQGWDSLYAGPGGGGGGCNSSNASAGGRGGNSTAVNGGAGGGTGTAGGSPANQTGDTPGGGGGGGGANTSSGTAGAGGKGSNTGAGGGGSGGKEGTFGNGNAGGAGGDGYARVDFVPAA